MCERAAGRSRGGGRTSRQQSLEQTTTTAMVQETLRKNTVTDTLSEITHSGHMSFQTSSHSPLPLVSTHPATSVDSFEMNAAQLEAEEQLELLLLEDEMSDSRMGSAAAVSSLALPQPVPAPSLPPGKQSGGVSAQTLPRQVTANSTAVSRRGSVPEGGSSGSALVAGGGYKPVLLGQRSTTPSASRGLEEMSPQTKLAHLGQRASQAYQVREGGASEGRRLRPFFEKEREIVF